MMSEQSARDQSSREPGNPALQDSDLFEPTLQAAVAGRRERPAEPWRVKSLMWIAFFGGSLALTAIAYLNGKRLKLSPARQHQVLLAGVAGFLLTLGAAYVLGQAEVAQRWQPGPGGSGFRLVSRAIALLAYLVILRLQRSAQRIYRFGGGEYASLWRPGLVAVMVLGTLQNFLAWFMAP